MTKEGNMADLRRIIGVTQITLGILLIIATVYISNLFAASHIQFTQTASDQLSALERAQLARGEIVPEYATIHTNYILLSNLYVALLVNFGLSALFILVAFMLILQGIVNKFAIPKLSVGYKPLLWLGLIGLVTVFIVLIIIQFFMRSYF